MRRYVFPVTPVGKPRQTQRDKWQRRPAVVQYRDFCDALRAYAAKARFTPPDAGLSITFYLPMPRSWSRKKRRAMALSPHQQKPDKDNLEKAFWDALKGDDSTVWHTASVEKRWAGEDDETGMIEVWVGDVPDEKRNDLAA